MSKTHNYNAVAIIQLILNETRTSRKEAAHILGLGYPTFQSKMEKNTFKAYEFMGLVDELGYEIVVRPKSQTTLFD